MCIGHKIQLKTRITIWMVIGMDSKVATVRSIFVRKKDLFLRLLVCNVEISFNNIYDTTSSHMF